MQISIWLDSVTKREGNHVDNLWKRVQEGKESWIVEETGWNEEANQEGQHCQWQEIGENELILSWSWRPILKARCWWRRWSREHEVVIEVGVE